jgi:hypothetical protein
MLTIAITFSSSLASKVSRNNFTTSTEPISVAELSQSWVCGRSPAGIAVSNPAGGLDVCLL